MSKTTEKTRRKRNGSKQQGHTFHLIQQSWYSLYMHFWLITILNVKILNSNELFPPLKCTLINHTYTLIFNKWEPYKIQNHETSSLWFLEHECLIPFQNKELNFYSIKTKSFKKILLLTCEYNRLEGI